jgi:hypothetical protein
VIEKLYEEVLEEGAIIDWMKANKGILKALSNELAYIGIPITSAGTMGIYVSQFLEKNFPNLPEQAIEKIAHFINNNPQILELLK